MLLFTAKPRCEPAMTIKESSDELNPLVVVPASEIAPPKRRRTIGDYVALTIATCGVGYFPIAPGTMGSLVGVGIYLLLRRGIVDAYFKLIGSRFVSLSFEHLRVSFVLICVILLVVIALSMVGIWAASRAERLFGRKDPGAVVIDEVVGQLITFVFVPFFLPLPTIVLGFILFRAFDIIKPYPIRKLEKLPSGLGIVVDDIAAGLYAGTVLSVILMLSMLHVLSWPL
jgi:phosphatidylglycerophosphatase A